MASDASSPSSASFALALVLMVMWLLVFFPIEKIVGRIVAACLETKTLVPIACARRCTGRPARWLVQFPPLSLGSIAGECACESWVTYAIA